MFQAEYLGLCRSCMHSEVCVLSREMNRSPVYCEEFQPEIFSAGQLSRKGFFKDSSRTFSDNANLLNRDLHQGLCCDCENRHTCNLISAQEGGVWYCEEYQ